VANAAAGMSADATIAASWRKPSNIAYMPDRMAMSCSEAMPGLVPR